jgi:hypothetical protein
MQRQTGAYLCCGGRPMKNADDNYGNNEAQRRFRAALKGAMTTPPKPLKSMTPVGKPSQQKKGKSKKKGSS